MNFIEELLFHSRNQPERAAIVLAEGRYISWRQLGAGIVAAQATLSKNGVTSEDLVSLEAADPIYHILLVCALLRSGICTINSGLEVSQRAEELGATIFLCGAEGLPPGFNAPKTARILTVGDDWFMPGTSGPDTGQQVHFKTGLPAIIFFTSGTTGEPTPCAKSSSQWRAWIATVKAQMDQTTCNRVLIIPDMLSGFGLATALASLWSGRTVFIIKTAQAAKAIGLYGIEYVVATPYILYALTDVIKHHNQHTRSVRGIRLAGAGASESLLHDISHFFTPNIWFAYSSTEAGAVAIAPLPVTGREPGFAGQVIPEVTLRIVDDSGEDVATGETGELLIRGKVVSLPYKDRLTSIKPGPEFWTRPGDLGHKDEQGNLVITGRISDIINIGGAKVRPEPIEEFLEKEPGIREAAVVSISPQTGKIEEVHIFVVGGNLDGQELKKEWHDALGIVRPHRLHVIPSLPRNRLGKIARGELRALARNS